MTIEIKDFGFRRTQETNEGAGLNGARRARPAETAPGGRAGEDSLTLTDAAVQLGQIEKALAAEGVVDTQRVDTLRNEITTGTYEVEPEQVAEKLIRFETEV